MPTQAQKKFGPKTIQLAAPNIEALFPKVEAEKELVVNTAPRAGQSWNIENVFFTFPGAEKNPDETTSGPTEFEFEIKMFIGGLEVASQKFLEAGQRGPSEGKTPFHVLGSLEPFAGATVYPGQDIRFLYRIEKNGTKDAMVTGFNAKIVVNYSLNAR